MSLIQEALEKAGRLPAMNLKPVPVEEKLPPQQEVKVEKIPAPKNEPFWLVDFKIKALELFDKMKIAPVRPGESRKTGLIASALVVLFLGAVFYVHTVAVKSPVGSVSHQGELAPFPSEIESQTPFFELTGITFSGTTRLALINNQVVGVGEKLKEGASVLEIQGQKVALDFQGKKIALEL